MVVSGRWWLYLYVGCVWLAWRRLGVGLCGRGERMWMTVMLEEEERKREGRREGEREREREREGEGGSECKSPNEKYGNGKK